MSLILDEHRQYLGDVPRLDAFERAIQAVVRPGDVVLDLAAGTGILGLLACRAGASRVFAVDGGPIVQMGRQLAAANGLSDKITFIRGFSTRIELPEKADVVVCDQIGHMGFEAGVFEYVRDALHRLVKSGGRSIPLRISIDAAALQSDDLRNRLDFWSTHPAGLDVSVAHDVALNTGYPSTIDGRQLLSAAVRVGAADVAGEESRRFGGQGAATVQTSGRMDGICAWFDAELAAGVHMTNRPGARDRIDRRCVMLPMQRPCDVLPGDEVAITLHVVPEEHLVTWKVEVRRPGVDEPLSSSKHSTFRGMLLTTEDLLTTNPAWRPELTPAGHARRLILDLCDGTRTLREIERLVFERHGALLPDAAAAAAFVGEVVSRYCIADEIVSSR